MLDLLFRTAPWALSHDNDSLGSSVSEVSFGTLRSRLGSFTQDLPLGTFAWKLSLKNFSLITVLGDFRLIVFARGLSHGNFVPGSCA